MRSYKHRPEPGEFRATVSTNPMSDRGSRHGRERDVDGESTESILGEMEYGIGVSHMELPFPKKKKGVVVTRTVDVR